MGQQMPVDSASVPAGNTFHLGFEKNINTYSWTFNGSFALNAFGWRLTGEERYLTTVIASDQDRIKDDQTLGFELAKPLSESIELYTQLNSFIFSDTRTQGLNKLSSNKFAGGFRWAADEVLTFTPGIGYSFDNQQSILDRGMLYKAAAELNGYRLGNNVVFGMASFLKEDLSPREQNEQSALIRLGSIFGDRSSNQATIAYRNFSRDFYILSDTVSAMNGAVEFPIETRTEFNYMVSDELRYSIAEPLSFGLSANVTQRNVDRVQKRRVVRPDNPAFDTNVDEFRANAGFDIAYRRESESLWKLRFDISERAETHALENLEWAAPEAFNRQKKLEEQKNNTISQTQFALQLTQRIGDYDTATVTGTAMKMQYDTPSEENNDDRDEVFFLTGVRWTHRFSPSLQATLQGDATLRHTVYLFSERSANNTWNRIFRIAPSTRYQAGRAFSTVNACEVLANYTVYDFESVYPDVRSFSFRQLTLSDSTTVRLGVTTSVTARLQVRMYERGELKWDEFKVRPTAFFDERTYVVFLSYEKFDKLLSAGFRMFEQTRYSYSGLDKAKTGILTSFGPTCRIEFRWRESLGMLIDGWYQITRDTGAETRTSPSVFIQLLYSM